LILQLLRNRAKISDEKLVAKYKKTGDNYFVGELFQRYTNLIVAVNTKYLRSKEDIEDATMQVFEILLEDLKKHEVRNFRAWLYSVVKNNSLKYKRHSKNYVLQDDDFSNQLYDDDSSEIEEKEKLEIQLDMLEDKMNDLKDDQKECLKLFYLENRSYKEIMDLTGLDLNKVKSHIQNGKRKLKIHLENNNNVKTEQ
jgi:RNA polymerase sigma-70 factor (ECF subfamily)